MWMLVCLIPAIIFLPILGDFIFLPGTTISDITITHYPNLYFLQQSIASGQGVPLWSPLIMSGYPFIADPLSGIHYPPGWLALLFPLPLGINLVVALHLCFGSYGMYRWLRAEGLSVPAAAIPALSFGMLPKLLAHYAAGHLTLLYAISWTPWLLWAEHAWRRSGGWRCLWRSPGVVLGLILLADPRWAIYVGILWVVVRVRGWLSERLRFPRLALSALDLLKNGLLALALSAVLLLPMIQFVGRSTRTMLTGVDALALSLPFSGLLNLVFPTSGGNVEWIAYPGAFALVFLVWGLSNPATARRAYFWFGVALVSLVLALGGNIPGMELLVRLPGLDLLRVPSRWLFISLFALVTAAGMVLHEVLAPAGKGQPRKLPLFMLAFALVVFTGGVRWLTGKLAPELWVASLFVVILVALLMIVPSLPAGKTFLAPVIAFLVIANSLVVGWFYFHGVPAEEVFSQGASVAEYLSGKPGPFRVYSPSYSLPQQSAARAGLQLADGVNPLQLKRYADFMIAASGVPSAGYSVTIPDYAHGAPRTDNQAYVPDAGELGWLNVCYVVSGFDLHAGGLEKLETIQDSRIYLNTECLPRAWVERGETRFPVEIEIYQTNRIDLTADGPGELVLSEIAYPGWMASIDGGEWFPLESDQLFRAVTLEAGHHLVSFRFKPLVAYLGAGISGLTLLLLIGLRLLARERP